MILDVQFLREFVINKFTEDDNEIIRKNKNLFLSIIKRLNLDAEIKKYNLVNPFQ